MNNSISLKDNQFFKDLNPEFLELLSENATEKEFNTHDYLFYEGEPANNFFLVKSGSVSVQVFGGELGFINIETITPGQIVGWTWLLHPYKWFFSGEATCLTKTLSFDAVKLREICDENVDLGFEISRILIKISAERLKMTRSKLMKYVD